MTSIVVLNMNAPSGLRKISSTWSSKDECTIRLTEDIKYTVNYFVFSASVYKSAAELEPNAETDKLHPMNWSGKGRPTGGH